MEQLQLLWCREVNLPEVGEIEKKEVKVEDEILLPHDDGEETCEE
jgi:hypothetical protein